MITLVMLVGPNRRDALAKALESAVPFVDQFRFVVWDPKAEDPGLADDLEWYGRTWRYSGSRFDEARNLALAVGTAAFGTVLMLDTDEQIAGDPEAWRAWVGDQTGEGKAAYVDVGGYSQVRVFRGAGAGEFHGRTHECFRGDVSLGHVPPFLLQVSEQAPKTREQFQAKAERDLPLLLTQLAEEPNDGRWHFYLGETHYLLGKYGEAVSAYTRCAELREDCTNPVDLEQGAWACFKGARAILDNGFVEDDYRAALACLSIGLNLAPWMPELPWFAAFLAHRCERPAKEIQAWARMAISIGAVEGRMDRNRLGFREAVAWFEGPYELMALAGAVGYAERADIARRMRAKFEGRE